MNLFIAMGLSFDGLREQEETEAGQPARDTLPVFFLRGLTCGNNGQISSPGLARITLATRWL